MVTCPACWSKRVRRAKHSGAALVLLLVLLRPCRCRDCGWRFWRPWWTVRHLPVWPMFRGDSDTPADGADGGSLQGKDLRGS